MPNKKISELNENLLPSGDNIIPVVASGNTDFISLSGLTNFVLSGVSSGSNYKIYTTLLTQSLVSTTSGLLVVGKTYAVIGLFDGDNFSNVGHEPLNHYSNFVATGTTPTSWISSVSVLNVTDSAPVATVLENTIGNIVWTRNSIGSYQMNFDSVDPFFIIDYNKVPMPKGICSTSPGIGAFNINVYSFVSNDTNSIFLDTASYDSMSGAYVYSDNLLQSSLIEIRIYN